MKVTSRFNPNISYFLIIGVVVSFLLSLALLQVFAGALCLLWIFEKWIEKKNAFDVFSKVFLIYLVVRIAALIFSEFPEVSVQILYKEVLFYLCFFSFSFYLKSFDVEKIKTIVYYFSFASAVIALIGIVRFNLSIVERAESFSSGYATFSSYLLTGLGCSLIFSGNGKKAKYFKWLRIFAAAVILAGIITSLGRANSVIAAVMLIASLLLKRMKPLQFIYIILIAAALSYISFQNNSIQLNQRIEAPTQLSDRDIIYKGASEIFLTHPLLGYGPKTFTEVFPHREDFADKGIGSWHNDLLEVYFESGFMGLASYLLLIFSVFFYQIKFLIMGKDRGEARTIIYAVLFATEGLFLSALVAGFINSPVLSLVFAFLIGVQSAVIKR
ncbi:MAG TPA: O-antigen ligase family protein [Ignavibacteriaceae bacterium]|nr:O-antigen ligase family protein [Ignavibacteriaceae bacterium]